LGLKFDSIQYSDFVETIARVRAMVLEGEFLSTVSCSDEEFAVAKRKKEVKAGLSFQQVKAQFLAFKRFSNLLSLTNRPS
jgi:hypothetical protein